MFVFLLQPDLGEGNLPFEDNFDAIMALIDTDALKRYKKWHQKQILFSKKINLQKKELINISFIFVPKPAHYSQDCQHTKIS